MRARQRTDIRALGHRVADLESLDLGDECIDELLMHILVHVDPLDRAARLPGVVHRAVRQRGRGHLDVDVVAHIDRILAAQLELQLDHLARHRARDRLARRYGAGEEHAVDGLPEQRRADVAGADDGREDRLRYARFVQHLGDLEAGACREFRRLVEHCIAGEERRDEHIAADEIRIIPRRDVGDDTERLVADELGHAVLVVDFAGLEYRTRVGQKEIDPRQEAVQLVLRLLQRLAHLAGEDRCEIVTARYDLLAEFADDFRATGERLCRPARLRLAREDVLALDAGRVVFENLGDDAIGGGVDDLEHSSLQIALAKMFAKSSRVQGRGLV